MTRSSKTDWYSAVWGSSGNDIYLGGYFPDGSEAGYSGLLHYDGSSWSPVRADALPVGGIIWGTSSHDVFALFYSQCWHFDGTTWSATSLPVQGSGIWGVAPDDIFVVGGNGAILHYNGNSWSTMTSPTTAQLKGVWGSSGNNVYAIGEISTPNAASSTVVLHYDGVSWAVVKELKTTKLNSLWGSSESNILAGGSGGYSLAGYSITLTEQRGPLRIAARTTSEKCGDFPITTCTRSIRAVTSCTTTGLDGSCKGRDSPNNSWMCGGTSVNQLFTVGSNGRILVYNGTSWSLMTSNTAYALQSIWGTSASDVYVVGYDQSAMTTQKSVILHYDGISWSVKKTVSNCRFSKVTGSSASNIFAAGLGCAYRSNGASWWGAGLPFPGWSATMDDGLESVEGLTVMSDTDIFAIGTEIDWYCVPDPDSSNPCFRENQVALKFDGQEWSRTVIGALAVDYDGYPAYPPIPFADMWGSDGSSVYLPGNTAFTIGSAFGKHYLWRYNGTSFANMNSGWPQDQSLDFSEMTSVWGSSADNVYAVGAYGLIVHYQGPLVGAPTSVAASDAAYADKVVVSWAAASGATGYRILRSDRWDRDFVEIGTTAAAVRVFNDVVECSQGHYYRVQAFNATKDSLHYTMNYGSTKIFAPPAPTGVSASDGAAKFQVQVAWNDVERESGYRSPRAPEGSGTYVQVGAVGETVTSYSGAATCGTQYTYKVQAFNATGPSDFSAQDAAATSTCGLAVGTPVDPWAQGSKQTVTWGGEVNTGAVRIDLYKGTAFKNVSPPRRTAGGTTGCCRPHCRRGSTIGLKITWAGNPSINGFSGPLVVAQPTLAVTGGSVAQGAPLHVGWSLHARGAGGQRGDHAAGSGQRGQGDDRGEHAQRRRIRLGGAPDPCLRAVHGAGEVAGQSRGVRGRRRDGDGGRRTHHRGTRQRGRVPGGAAARGVELPARGAGRHGGDYASGPE